MHIILNNSVEFVGDIGCAIAYGRHIRDILPSEMVNCTILRENNLIDPDQLITDAMEIGDGDVFYTLPPCFN